MKALYSCWKGHCWKLDGQVDCPSYSTCPTCKEQGPLASVITETAPIPFPFQVVKGGKA